jgi:uncharacterized protein (UPF0332 family)
MVEQNVYLRKASESLAGAKSEYVNGRYNNCTNRCYYACFQAAVHALVVAGIQPPDDQGRWGHDFVQSAFVGQLINRRKFYPTELRESLFRNLNLRHEADYGTELLTQTEAIRGLRRTREFVETILAKA